MGQRAGNHVVSCRSDSRVMPPVLLREVLRLLQDAMLHGSRLRVAVAPPPAQLARLAEQLDSLAGELRGLVAGRI